MSISILKGLSPNEKKQAILKISKFVLRESSRDVRESIYRRLLKVGMYLLDMSNGVTLDDILVIIEKNFYCIITKLYLNYTQFKSI